MDAYRLDFELRPEDLSAWHELNLLGLMFANRRFLKRLVTPSAYLAFAVTGALTLSNTVDRGALVSLYLLIPAYWLLMVWRFRRRIVKWIRTRNARLSTGPMRLLLFPAGIAVLRNGYKQSFFWNDVQWTQWSGYHFFLCVHGDIWPIPLRSFKSRADRMLFMQAFASYSGIPVRCPSCGYCLIGTSNGRCPECGYPNA